MLPLKDQKLLISYPFPILPYPFPGDYLIYTFTNCSPGAPFSGVSEPGLVVINRNTVIIPFWNTGLEFLTFYGHKTQGNKEGDGRQMGLE